MQPHRVERTRLVERLRRSAERRVALVIAPPGFGKSTLIRQARDVAGIDAFYRVPPESRTLLAFLRGLTSALEASVPGAHLSLAIAYERAIQSSSPGAELALWLSEHLRGASIRIAIDDLHYASAPEVPEFVQRSVEMSPDSVQWLLVLREGAKLPLASWLAHGICDVPIAEAELRFSPAEVESLAADVAPELAAAAVSEIAVRTGGWPAATALALQLGDAGTGTPLDAHAMYDELAARVIDAIPQPERSRALKSAVLPDAFDDRLLRAFALARLHERGPQLEREALLEAADACERTGDVRAALAFYQRAGVPDAMCRILKSHGIALMDGGFADVVEAAIAALDREAFDGGPAIMALKALRDAHLVRFDSAEAWFQLAISASAGDDDLRLRIVHRYALDLLRRGRVDAIDVLEPAIASSSPAHAYHPLLCATLATAYALVDRLDDARTSIASAMENLRPNLLPALRTRAYHQAAYVALRCSDIPEARRYAERVLDVAVPNGFYDLAARAHSILYEIAHAWDANPQQALAHVDSVAEFGLKSGDTHIRQWTLMAAYYVEAERGNGDAMTAIERGLNAPEVLQTTDDTNAALLPGQALRATWSGDFARAYRLLEHSEERGVSAEKRAFYWAEVALFAAAAGLHGVAREAAAAARADLPPGLPGKHGIQAAAYLLVALSLLGDRDGWSAVHALVTPGDRNRPGAVFVQAAEALHRHWLEERDHHLVLGMFAELRMADFGGIAALFEALPAAPSLNVKTT